MNSELGGGGGRYNLRRLKRKRMEEEEVQVQDSSPTDKTAVSSDFFEEEDDWDDGDMDVDDLYEEGEEDDLVSEGEVDCQLSPTCSKMESGSSGESGDQLICGPGPSTSGLKISGEDKDGEDGYHFEVMSAAQIANCMEGIVNEVEENI